MLKLQEVLNERNITVEELAEEAAVPACILQAIIDGRRDASPLQQRAIAYGLMWPGFCEDLFENADGTVRVRRVEALRRAQHIPKATLAIASGLSETVVCNACNENRTVTPKTLKRLAWALNYHGDPAELADIVEIKTA